MENLIFARNLYFLDFIKIDFSFTVFPFFILLVKFILYIKIKIKNKKIYLIKNKYF